MPRSLAKKAKNKPKRKNKGKPQGDVSHQKAQSNLNTVLDGAAAQAGEHRSTSAEPASAATANNPMGFVDPNSHTCLADEEGEIQYLAPHKTDNDC